MGDIIMSIFYFIGIIVILCVLQFILSTRTNNAFIKYLPITATIISLLFCFVIYLNVIWADSPSVIAENQHFARFLSVPLGASFIGCLLGLLIYKLIIKSNK